ncbi:hypothetical protein J3A83DRAFT_4186044 [Scleroderma citrinum]
MHHNVWCSLVKKLLMHHTSWIVTVEDNLNSLSEHSDSASSLEERKTVPQSTESPHKLNSGFQEAVPPNLVLQAKVKVILSKMSEIRLSLTEFLDAISWGGSDCISNSQIHGACTSLMNSPRCLHKTINDELETAAKLFKSPDDASNTFFMKISFCGLSDDLQATAPTLWSLLRQSAHMEKKYLQESNQGLSAKTFDTLHALTVMMSHKWAADHVQMSEAAMKEHLHNKDNFSSGAAVTVYIKHHAETLKADSSHELQQCCAWGMKSPLTSLEIFHLGQLAVPHIQNQMTYEVLCFLLEAPEFNIKSYQYHDSSLLLPPEPVHALPHSKEHVTLQYMLGSVNIPGVSYADNKHLVDE